MTKRTEKEAARLIEVSQYDTGTIYKCLLCGDTVKVNCCYHKSDHKAMIKHAMTCEGGKHEQV